jgi:hypothetical protein
MMLLELQSRVAAAIMAPVAPAGREIGTLVKPNDRLTAAERIEIYRISYWQRLLDSLRDDFPGLRAVLGARAFDRLAKAYFSDLPSQSFTMRDLGSRLEAWLREHPGFGGGDVALALDMIRLEWAHIEAFDAAEAKPLGPEDLLEPGPELRLGLQPHLSLLDLRYPVDDLRIRVLEPSIVRRLLSKLRRPDAPCKPVFLAVHRVDFTVYYRRLEADEFRILDDLRHGACLGEAIDSMAEPGDIETWFAAWSRLGWLCRPGNESQ